MSALVLVLLQLGSENYKHFYMKNITVFLLLACFAFEASAAQSAKTPPPDSTFYYDFDNDGFGDPNTSVIASFAPLYYVSNNLDCVDTFSSINPAAIEICDGFDNDCDGLTDTLIDSGPIWFLDADADGFGDASYSSQFCTQPVGYVNNAVDCNDDDASISPGNMEICNEIDDDCTGTIDENAGTFILHKDQDGDGYGNPLAPILFCAPTVQPGYSDNHLDCDDTNADINPTTIWYHDLDEDGYGLTADNLQACTPPSQYALSCSDCNDGDPSVNPGSIEVAANGMDDDCNDVIDDACKKIDAIEVVNNSPTSLIVIWPAVNDAGNYQVRYRVSGTTTWSPIFGTSVNYYRFDNLLANTSYQFRVRSRCGSTYTPFSPIVTKNTTTTAAACVAPTKGGVFVANQSAVRVFWNYVPNSTRYRVLLRPIGNSSYTIILGAVSPSGNAIAEKSIAGLLPNTTYQYRVQVRCLSGTWAAPSTIGTFTTKREKCEVSEPINLVAPPNNEAISVGNENDLALSPNPTSDFLELKIAKDATLLTVSVYNTMGLQVISQSTEPVINVHGLPAGIYVVRAVTNLGEVVKPFVKM